MKKYINLNNLFTEHFVNTLVSNGVKQVVISPGSRNTPLIIAFDKNKNIKKHVVIDERSNAFFALGLAKQSREPVALVTTSGTAVAELYPAVIEAYYSRVPLIICSADRPARLVNKGTNQTIDQRNIYKNHIRYFWDSEEILPAAKYFKSSLTEWIKGLSIGLDSNTGPIHFNMRFEKPLESYVSSHQVDSNLFEQLNKLKKRRKIAPPVPGKISKNIIASIQKSEKTLVMIGSNINDKLEIESILKFTEHIDAPIIADGLSNFRYGSHSKKRILINSTAFIRNRNFIEKLDPALIIQFGNAPTSNILLNFYKLSKSTKVLVNTFGDITDPSESYNAIIKQTILTFTKNVMKLIPKKYSDSAWIKTLYKLDNIAQQFKQNLIHRSAFSDESQIIKELFNTIQPQSNLMVSNSIPPRDIDYFADNYRKSLKLYHNRGASGIDGIISTAAGIQLKSNKQTYLLIGDTAFLHDTNGLWLLSKYNISLKIILINNSGGAIFEMLPVFMEKIDFIKYFKVPTGLNFKDVVKAFGGKHIKIKNWNHFREKLSEKSNHFEVLEIVTDSKSSLETRKRYWNSVVEKSQEILDAYNT